MKPAKELWADYLFLTREMAKFLEQEDLDLFFELLDQRDRLQKSIDECHDDYKRTEIGRRTLAFIYQENQRMTTRLQGIMNKTTQSHNMARAYDSLGTTLSGVRLDRKS